MTPLRAAGFVALALCYGGVIAFCLKEVLWRERRSLRTLLIMQVWMGALVAFGIRLYLKSPYEFPSRELLVMAVLWVPLMWSIIRDKSLPKSHGKGRGWERFRRRNIPQGTLRMR